MNSIRIPILALALAAGPASLAEEGPAQVPAQVHAAAARLVPNMPPDQIALSPVPGLYEMTFGPHVVYVSADGRYILRGGDLVDIEAQRNLTEERRREGRLRVLETLGEESMIVFAPAESRFTVTIFTDVDCPYCARLHRQIAEYNELGITVRYAAFPRAGIPSHSYEKTVSVWCSDDPQDAIGVAKAGRSVPPRQCENPVADHYTAGRVIGISGTPAIVLANGTIVPGYVPPKRLRAILDGDT